MGKIRVAALGSDEEKKLKEDQRIRREEKKKREAAEKVHVPGTKGGESMKSVGTDEADMDKMVALAKNADKIERIEGDSTDGEKKKTKKEKFQKSGRSKRYQSVLSKVDHAKQYPLADALVLLREVDLTKFVATVELHINTIEKGLRGTMQLPHGTGKEVRVAIADPATIEKFLEKVQNGTIDFDALVAHPAVMPKLAKVAKILGPRGLMPNPKNGTISPKPQEVAEKLKGGEITWKTETDHPVIHQAVGKLSFKDSQLEENITAFIKSVGKSNIKNITLKSTMSPGIRLQHQAA